MDKKSMHCRLRRNNNMLIRKNLVGVEDLDPHLGRLLPYQLGGQPPLIEPHLYDWARGTADSTRVEPAMSRFEISGDVSNNKTVPTISPDDLKAVEKLIKRPTVGFRANRNVDESKRSTQNNIKIQTRPQVEARDLVDSKDPYVPSNIPKLREQWFDRNSDLLGPIPLELPPFREINHRISLIDDNAKHNYYMPRCPEALQEELREKITRYVTAGWWEMKPVYQAAPLLCVPKTNGKLRTVVDERKRNDNTYKDVTPFPDQDQIRMDVARSRYRTKIDMSDAYEQIRIENDDVWKTAFASPFGTFVPHVMQQGDCNAPATFQRLMTWIFRDHLRLFVRVYLDDIFIFSDTIREHEEHLRIVFSILRKHRLYISRSKLDLYSSDMDCLGHRIDDQGLHADTDKMARVCEWRTLRSYPEVLRFVGLVKYLAHFMPDVSAYTSPLESICSNGQPFQWRPLHQTCLDRIKDLARKTPILKPIDTKIDEKIWVISDASSYGVGVLYGQGPDWQTCRPAGFMSKKFTSAQRSYRTFEHEALAVIEALMKWEDKLVGRKFHIVTDHEALETIKTSNRDGKSGRLIRWDEYLSRFKYEIMHVPGVTNKVADCLSRYYENDRYDEIHESHHYVSADVRLDPNHEDLTDLRLQEILELKPSALLLARRLRDRNEDRVAEAERMANAIIPNLPQDAQERDLGKDMTVGEALQNGPPLDKIVLGDGMFLEAIKSGYKNDPMFSKILENPGHYLNFRVFECIIHTKNLLGDECLCIPRALYKGKHSLPEVTIDHAHDTLGHLGSQKTSEYARRWFWWPRRGGDIEN